MSKRDLDMDMLYRRTSGLDVSDDEDFMMEDAVSGLAAANATLNAEERYVVRVEYFSTLPDLCDLTDVKNP
jgi:hypothetical protein